MLPAGIFGEILETHQRGHPTLLSSHTDGTNGAGSFENCGVVRMQRMFFLELVGDSESKLFLI